MDAVLEVLRSVVLIAVCWSVTSVIVAVPVAALFRVQARTERIWQQLERRRAWREDGH
jgi:hypothetical protein